MVKRYVGLYTDTKKFEDYLSSMAKKGYIFKKIVLSNYIVFEKGQPSNVKYYVDYYIPFDSEELKDYYNMRKSLGLSIVYSKDCVHIFEYESDDLDLVENKNIRSSIQKRQLSKIFSLVGTSIFLNCLFYFRMLLPYSKQGSFSSPSKLYFSVFACIAFLLALIKMAEYYSNRVVIKGKQARMKVLITNSEVIGLIIFKLFVFFIGLMFFD